MIKSFFGGPKRFDSKFTTESFSLVSYLFNSICTSQGPMFFICREDEEIFGGYVSQLEENESKPDQHCFLFSLTKEQKINAKEGVTPFITNRDPSLIMFGP